jgi:hypothetical protein
MIMGGSSGSAVLNENGELSGVVFAGEGKGFSYAFIVPYEYVARFIREESLWLRPTYLPLEIKSEEKEANKILNEKKKVLKESCKNGTVNKKVEKICAYFEKDLIWENKP